MDDNKDNGITAKLINDILISVKMMLNITDNSQDSLLVLYITMICNNILVKTHRRKFIPELKYIVINLVKDKFDSNNTNNPDLNVITSMSEAGRSVNFGASSVTATKLNLIAQKQLEENESIIKEYRLLYRT